MSTVDNPEEDTYNVGFDGIEFNDDELRKIKEKASPFTAGMNPTVLIHLVCWTNVLSASISYNRVSEAVYPPCQSDNIGIRRFQAEGTPSASESGAVNKSISESHAGIGVTADWYSQ